MRCAAAIAIVGMVEIVLAGRAGSRGRSDAYERASVWFALLVGVLLAVFGTFVFYEAYTGLIDFDH